MLALETEHELAQLIMAICREEKAQEVLRQVLAEQTLYEPYAAFQRLDRDSHGYLSSRDLHRFLR